MSRRLQHQSASGFTLVEMMVVVAILGIIMGIAAPSAADFLRSQKINGAVSALHGSLIFARSEAIKRNATVTITRSGSAWESGWTIATGGTPLRNQDAIADATISAKVSGTAISSVSYIGSGRPGPSSSNAQFMAYLASQPTLKPRCITMGLSGMPMIATDTDTDTSNGC